MSPATIFQIHLVLGYVPWLFFFSAYAWPKLKTHRTRVTLVTPGRPSLVLAYQRRPPALPGDTYL
jgi:hypothetical protein